MGIIVVRDLIFYTKEEEVKLSIVIMDKVHLQSDEMFLSLLDNFWYGNVTNEQAHYAANKFIEKKTDEEKLELKDAQHLFPMWKLSHPIVLKYLKGFTETMAKMRAKY